LFLPISGGKIVAILRIIIYCDVNGGKRMSNDSKSNESLPKAKMSKVPTDFLEHGKSTTKLPVSHLGPFVSPILTVSPTNQPQASAQGSPNSSGGNQSGSNESGSTGTNSASEGSKS
jgi:hypothetical protein